jgi:hypothetical protein
MGLTVAFSEFAAINVSVTDIDEMWHYRGSKVQKLGFI